MGEVKQNYNPAFAWLDEQWFGTFIVGRNERPADEPDDGLPGTFHWACPYLEMPAFRSLLIRAAYLTAVASKHRAIATWFEELVERHPSSRAWVNRLIVTQRVRLFAAAAAMGQEVQAGRCRLPGDSGAGAGP